MRNRYSSEVTLPSGIVRSRFSTRSLSRSEQVLAWRGRVGHVVDVPPSREQLEAGFVGHIDRFDVGGLVFTDCSTDAMVLERSVARVSTDARRDYAFHLFIEGGLGNLQGMHRKRTAADVLQGIVALDMSQPFKADRTACRVLSLFVPWATVEAALPDAGSIHGRAVQPDSPLGRMILEHVAATARDMSRLDPQGAADALSAAAELLLAAFREEARLTGAERASVQAAVMGQVRRYVDANLHNAELTPTSVVEALHLKRATIYRWFEHEGGLGTYIRNRRLREAADELVHFPQLQVAEIAYGMGFKSASDFTRAFRRAFSMSPLDMRARAFELQRDDALA